MNNIQVYNEIVAIRTTLKAVQQLSWDIQAMEKRYPLMSVYEDDLPLVLEIYRGLYERLATLTPKSEE